MPSKSDKASDPRLQGRYKLPSGGVIGQGGGVGEGTRLPDKDVTRDPKGGKEAVWKTGKTG
jgi:hypothetical protein